MANSELSLEQQEQILEGNRDFIIKRLDVDEVIDELIHANLIGQNAAQRVQLTGTSRVEKNRIIFDQLITCGPDALEKFCEILKRRKRQSFIAVQLEKCIHSTTTSEPAPSVKCSPLDVSRLKARYIKHLSTDHTDWPLQYVRLALVKGEKVTRADKNLEEITRLTLQGQVDELLLRKEPLGDVRDIFHYENKPCPRLILIIGGPGIGKTTLAHHICVKWARDGFLAEDFDAIILIPLRSVQRRSLEEVTMEHIGEGNYQQMKKSAGSKCLIILEGLDEISVDHRKNDPFLLHLIKECTVLEKAIVIITSRPHACEEIDAGRRIEIVGFGKNEIREFVEKSFSKEPRYVKEFLQQLDEYPQLHSLCYVPLHLLMVVDIFHYCEKRLPSTLTELYQLFIVMTLKRQVKKENVAKKPSCSSLAVTAAADNVEEGLCVMLRGIPKETVGIVLCLSRLAYRGFFDWYCHRQGEYSWENWKEPKIIFTESDLKQCDIQVTSDFDGFGLLKGTQTQQLLTDINTYSFNHLSTQEILCAVYISLQSQQEQLNLLREHFDEYPNVFTFVCGLTGLASSEMFQFIYSMLTLPGGVLGDPRVIIATSCIHESKQSSIPDQSVSPFTLNMNLITLLPYNCLCVSSVLSCCPVSELKMRGCSVGNKGAELLVKHYPNKNTTDQLLEELDLKYNDLTSEGIVDVMKIVKTSSAALRVLNINRNDIGDEGMAMILEALQHNKSLITLSVARCGLSVKGAVYISQLLNVTPTLQWLDMSINIIGDEGMAKISEALQHNKSLTTLRVAECKLSMKGAISISKMMMVNHSLQELYISYNNIGDDGISAIAGALGNCKISKLNVKECGISVTGARSLATALYSSNTIRVLSLQYNSITVEGALLIVNSAVHNTVCQHVEIDYEYKNDEIQRMMNILKNRRQENRRFHRSTIRGITTTTTTTENIEKNVNSRSEEVAGDGAAVNMEMSLINQSEDDYHSGGQEETRGYQGDKMLSKKHCCQLL